MNSFLARLRKSDWFELDYIPDAQQNLYKFRSDDVVNALKKSLPICFISYRVTKKTLEDFVHFRVPFGTKLLMLAWQAE